MKLLPEIKEIEEKKLIGQNLDISFSNNLTYRLWQNFMSGKNKINNILSNNLISMQIYPVSFDFTPNVKFKKWAAVEVSHIAEVPEGMESFILSGGLYAVFHYKGSGEDTAVFRYIFTEWLSQSEYVVDNTRPHFELLGEKYKNNDPESEEDIYIPIKSRII